MQISTYQCGLIWWSLVTNTTGFFASSDEIPHKESLYRFGCDRGAGVMMIRQAALDKEPMKVATLTGTYQDFCPGKSCWEKAKVGDKENVRKL